MDPRSAPGGLRSGPRGAETAPRGAKSTPRAPQEPPERRKKGAKKVTIFGWALGVASGRPPGAILARFWRLRGPFWRHFSKTFRSMVAALRLSSSTEISQLKALSGRAAAREAPSACQDSLSYYACVLYCRFGCSRCSCRSCGAAPSGAGVLPLAVLAAFAVVVPLAMLAASPRVLRRLQCLRLLR